MFDLTDILARLDAMEAHYRDRAAHGLRRGAADAQAWMRATTAYQDQTGATRAGSVAYVVTPADDGGAAIDAAVDAIEGTNRGRSATDPGVLPGEIGVVLTVPTDYQEFLERRFAGEHAVLAPALAAFADELTARAAEGG